MRGRRRGGYIVCVEVAFGFRWGDGEGGEGEGGKMAGAVVMGWGSESGGWGEESWGLRSG